MNPNGSRPGAAITPVHLVLGAVLLVAVAAVLLLGRKDPEPPAPTATAVTAEPTPAVTPTLTEARTGPRTAPVLGKTGNPFKPARGAGKSSEKPASAERGATPGKAAPATTTPTLSSGATGSGSGTSSGSGSGSSGGGRTPSGSSEDVVTGRPAPTPTPRPTRPAATPAPTAMPASRVAYQPVVRLATRSGGSTSWPIARLQPLPGSGTPVAVFVGLRPGFRSGVFVVAPGVAVSGGRCAPARDRCKRLELRAGQTATLVRDGIRFRLGLPKIERQRVSPERERQMRLQVSGDDGRAALRSLIDQVGGLRYDAAKGVVTGG